MAVYDDMWEVEAGIGSNWNLTGSHNDTIVRNFYLSGVALALWLYFGIVADSKFLSGPTPVNPADRESDWTFLETWQVLKWQIDQIFSPVRRGKRFAQPHSYV